MKALYQLPNIGLPSLENKPRFNNGVQIVLLGHFTKLMNGCEHTLCKTQTAAVERNSFNDSRTK